MYPNWCPPPTSYSLIGRGLYAPGCSERIQSGGRNMLSISQNNICLPARAFKTINKIREHTKATVPLLPPSVSFSSPPPIPSHFVLAHLPVQCRHSVVCLHLLSSGNFSTKPPYADRQQWHTHTHTEAQTNTQGRKLTQILIHSCWRRTFTISHTRTHTLAHTHTLSLPPANLLLCSLCATLTEINEPKMNQRRLYKHYTVLEKLSNKKTKEPARTQRCTLFP